MLRLKFKCIKVTDVLETYQRNNEMITDSGNINEDVVDSVDNDNINVDSDNP